MDRLAVYLIAFIIALFCLIDFLGSQAFEGYRVDIQRDHNHCRAKEDTEKYHESKDCQSFLYKTIDDPVAFFTGGLFIFTMALALFTLRLVKITKDGISEQAELTRRAIRHADRSAKAAETAITNAITSSEMQLRAYVTIQAASVQLIINDRFALFTPQITLCNSGRTPAFKFCTSIGGDVYPFDDLPFPEMKPNTNPQYSILSNIGKYEINCNPVVISHYMLEEIRCHVKAIFIWGRVDYTDIFGVERYFIYRDRVSGREGVFVDGRMGWAFRPHPVGYEAN